MNLVIVIHNSYNSVDCALARDNQVLVGTSITKELASAQLIPTIDALLAVQHYDLSDLSHIIVNQGPAPFTTLRTIIVTANGIAFAHKIPLVGVDALDAFMSEYTDRNSMPCIVLLNAFNKAVYYDMTDPGQQKTFKGYAPIESCIAMIQSLYKDMPLQFVGNGTQLYRAEIESTFGNQAHIPDPLPLTASLQQILKKGIDQIGKGQGITQFIEPLYLKKPVS